LPADLLDDTADPVDVDAVLPALAGVEGERPPQRRQIARHHSRRAGGLDITQRVGIPVFVGEPGGVGQQVLQGDWPPGRAEPRHTGSVEAVEHLRHRERRIDVRDRRIEAELAFLDKLHRRDASDRLGHRKDAEDRIERHPGPGPEVTHSERALVDRPLRARRHSDDPRHLARFDRAAQRLVDLPLASH